VSPPLTGLEGLTDEESFILDTCESDRDFLQLLSTTPCAATPSDMNQALSATPHLPPTPTFLFFFCAILEIFSWMVLRKRVKAQRVLAFAHILQDYFKLLKREGGKKNRKWKQREVRLKKGLRDVEPNGEAKDQVLYNSLIIFANEPHCKILFCCVISAFDAAAYQ
jgi:hypothetical protein